MESWSYVLEGKGFVSHEAESTPDSAARNRDLLMGWHVKTPIYGNNLLVSGQQTSENQAFNGESGFSVAEMLRKQVPNDSIGDVLSSKGSFGRMGTLNMTAPNAFSGEEESTSKLSSSVVDSNCRDSLLIDLKLGRFADCRDNQNSKIFSSVEPSVPAKRARSMGLNSQTFFCQVHGCNKDLSSSKDYHRRHKVCEVHSKTAKVIVNGIEQRFCQQCSRFHVLAEFDDGKRSCRKRLAGHNERRRKPQVACHLSRTGKFQSYDGSRLDGTSSKKTSFICQDILSSGLLHAEKYGTNDWSRGVKVELGDDYSPPSAIPITTGRLHSKSLFPTYNLGKQYPNFHDSETSTLTGSILRENGNQYSHMSGQNCSLQSFFQDTSFGGEDFNAFNTASTVQGFPTISSSGALSLLSSQPQNSSSHSSELPMSQSLNITGCHAHYSVNQVSEKLLRFSPQGSASGLSNKFSSSAMDDGEGNHLGRILISESDDAVNFEVTDGFFQGPDLISAKDRLTCQDGATIDLFQLSSHLERVERQRQSMQVKQENDAFCCLRIT